MGLSLLLSPTTLTYSKSHESQTLKHNFLHCASKDKHTRLVANPIKILAKKSLSFAIKDSNKLNTRRRRFECQAQLAELAPATSAAYGLLLLGGGLFAFSRSGSKGSLYGGLTGGALSAAAFLLMQAPETKATGDALAFGSAFVFACVFGIRLAATRKVAPAGPLLGLSIFALIIYISAYIQDKI